MLLVKATYLTRLSDRRPVTDVEVGQHSMQRGKNWAQIFFAKKTI